MDFPKYLIEQLIPFGEPDRIRGLGSFYERSFQIEDSLLRRSYLWANAILERFAIGPFQSDYPFRFLFPDRSRSISAGFVYINPGLIESNNSSFIIKESFAFGISVLVHSDNKEERQEIFPLSFEEKTIPIVVNYGRFELHSGPPHPAGGTGSCWVENQIQHGSWTKGILTCAHVVNQLGLGTTIGLSPSSYLTPTAGIVCDYDLGCIDGAIVGIDPKDWPTGLSTLNTSRIIAPGSTGVNFMGKASTKTGTVLRVCYDPIYFGNQLGQRVFTDCYGNAGDSGTLLLDSSNNGIGIYMGTTPDGAGGYEGLFQDLYQIQRYFRLNLFN